VTFRFSGGCASPGESITVRLTGPYGSLALLGVQGWRQASTTVVSKSVSKSGPGLSAWELACHALPTTVFAAQRIFALPVSARYRPSPTVPSGTQRARRRIGGRQAQRDDHRSWALLDDAPSRDIFSAMKTSPNLVFQQIFVQFQLSLRGLKGCFLGKVCP
jgi:hypothetical protein